jgi:hypothetical protein
MTSFERESQLWAEKKRVNQLWAKGKEEVGVLGLFFFKATWASFVGILGLFFFFLNILFAYYIKLG